MSEDTGHVWVLQVDQDLRPIEPPPMTCKNCKRTPEQAAKVGFFCPSKYAKN